MEAFQYCLGKETALVFVSAVTFAPPGSASATCATGPSASAETFAAAPDATCVVTVEHMQKVSKDEVAALTVSMTAEWKSVLTPPEDLCKQEYRSARDPACWTPESARKVQRVQSEPMSPGPTSE